MEITRTITVNLTPEEIKNIIKDYLSKEGFEINEESIEFKVSAHIEGYGYDEHEVKTFNGCSVGCKIKTKRTTEAAEE